MTAATGHIELDRTVESIQVGRRHRRDLGDLDALAASIERDGLLQPITITPDGGAPVTLNPGDAFVVEPNFKGTWKIEAPVRKHFAIKLK